MPETLRALEEEVARFRAWAASAYPRLPRLGEWEMSYTAWDRLYAAFGAFVAATSCRDWDAAAAELLLYAIARDNETERLVREVAEHPDDLVWLAERAAGSAERDARWQLAHVLSALEPRPPQVEALLLCYARDEDEYVRRRALLALAAIGSPRLEELVEPAWESGEEYQRIAVLCALDQVGSPLVAEYAARAEADGGEHLAKYAAAIRESGTLREFRVQGLPVID